MDLASRWVVPVYIASCSKGLNSGEWKQDRHRLTGIVGDVDHGFEWGREGETLKE
jgi:hypothetical protein